MVENEYGNKVIIALPILAALILAALLLWVKTGNQAQTQRLTALREEALPLERQRETLLRQLSGLKVGAEPEFVFPATEELLVTEPDEDLYTNVYPLMRQYGFTGVMGISADGRMPGIPGAMSYAHFNEMLQAGWTLCLVYDGGMTLERWANANRHWLEDVGIPWPETVYLPEGSLSVEQAGEVLNYGFTTAVYPLSGQQTEIVRDTEGPRLYFARPWSFDNAASFIDSLAKNGGNAVFTLSFSPESADAFNQLNFTNMLNYLKNYTDQGNYHLASFAQAQAIQEEAAAGAPSAEAVYEREKSRLQAEIHALDTQIHAIYADWDVQS